MTKTCVSFRWREETRRTLKWFDKNIISFWLRTQTHTDMHRHGEQSAPSPLFTLCASVHNAHTHSHIHTQRATSPLRSLPPSFLHRITLCAAARACTTYTQSHTHTASDSLTRWHCLVPSSAYLHVAWFASWSICSLLHSLPLKVISYKNWQVPPKNVHDCR